MSERERAIERDSEIVGERNIQVNRVGSAVNQQKKDRTRTKTEGQTTN